MILQADRHVLKTEHGKQASWSDMRFAEDLRWCYLVLACKL